jgi:flagellar basal-body rod protein FlgG
MRALSTAVTGMNAQQTAIDVVSNNLANISTTGYKQQHAAFEDLIYQSDSRAGVNPSGNQIIPTGTQIGLGTQLSGIYRVNSQGDMQQTSNVYDLAIQGQGYFSISMEDGSTAYTRAGNFTINPEGKITTLSGDLIEPNITIPNNATSVTISNNGAVSVVVNHDSTNPENVGTIQLTTFINENGLNSIGQNLFKETPASGSPTTSDPGTGDVGKIMQGWLESSNIDPVKELTSLIKAQRSYEICSKVINASDEILRTITNVKG